MKTNVQWRQEKRLLRGALSTADRQQHSQQIADHMFGSRAYQTATHIAVYFAMPEEVDVTPIIERAWSDGKTVYLPIVTAKAQPMLFAQYTRETVLTKDVMHMDVPSYERRLPPMYLDLVIMPLVAFDALGQRVGMGGGYYDRTFVFKADLPKAPPQLFGVGFEVQRTESILETQPWDIHPDAIVSELGFLDLDKQ